MDTCPCGSKLPFSTCCEPIITEKTPAETAEQLMRSRYTAYVKGAVDFILNSTLEEKRKECDEKAIKNWSKNSVWHKLDIISTEKGTSDDTEGVVEFEAVFTESGIKKNLHEKAVFKKIDGYWFYIDGEIQKPKPFIRTDAKISRNDPCICGSGKKYKKCCGAE